jgi:hypothetical protein
MAQAKSKKKEDEKKQGDSMEVEEKGTRRVWFFFSRLHMQQVFERGLSR